MISRVCFILYNYIPIVLFLPSLLYLLIFILWLLTIYLEKLLTITDDLNSLEICPIFANFLFAKPNDNENEEDNALFPNIDIEAFSDEDVPDAPYYAGNDNEDDIIEQQEAHLLEEIQSQDDDGEGDGENQIGNAKVIRCNHSYFNSNNIDHSKCTHSSFPMIILLSIEGLKSILSSRRRKRVCLFQSQNDRELGWPQSLEIPFYSQR